MISGRDFRTPHVLVLPCPPVLSSLYGNRPFVRSSRPSASSQRGSHTQLQVASIALRDPARLSLMSRAVRLVHADVPHPDWAVATAMLEAGAPDHVDDASEDEVRRHRSRPVAGLRALVHGHFVVDEVERLANRWNIDTGATFPGRDRLTLLHVNARPIRPWTFDVDES